MSRQLKPSRSNKTENKTALEMRAKEITKAPTGSLPTLEIGSDFPLGPRLRYYAGFELLIIDEFGFDKLEREENPQAPSLLYKVIDSRTRKRSTALS